METTRFADHELIEQPVCFIYFISATESDPLHSIDNLKRPEKLPRLYKEGVYEDSTNMIISFVFILNPTDNPKLAEEAKESVKQKFAP